jgi:carotenoid cleavage dioxygenase-like enzyme
MHSFGFVTPEGAKPGPDAEYEFAVLVHHPFYMDLTKEFPEYKLPMEAIWEFDTTEPVRVYVVDLKKGALAANLTLNGEPFLYSHTTNSFQVDGQIYLDLVGYRQSFFKRYSFATLLNKTARDASAHSETLRLKLDLGSGIATQEVLLPGADMEFPTINEYFKGRENCYVWSLENNFHPPEPNTGATGFASMAATKFNVCESAKHRTADRTSFYRPNTYYGEAFFVPRPGGTKEDDGVVMLPSLNGTVGRMTLLVLDAVTMKPLAEVPLPEGAGGYMTHTRYVFDFDKQLDQALVV